MKKFIYFMVIIALAAGLGFVLWTGFRKQSEKVAETSADAAAPAEEAKAEEYSVVIEKKKAVALALEKEQPESKMLQAQRMAFGTVIDPTGLVTVDGDLTTAEAALASLKIENDRSQALVATNDTSRKSAEADESQYIAARIKLETLVRSVRLQWGSLIDTNPVKRSTLINELASGSVALLRVDLLPGDALAELPTSARIVVMGREGEAFSTTEIIPATATDVKTQSQGYLLRVKPPFTLRPGMALTAWLALPEKPRPGFVIPRAAVLRHDGRTWVYVQSEAEKYVRKPVRLDTPLDGDQGWFITTEGGLAEDDVIVVVGAASLLSEELKAQSGGEPD